MKDELPSSTQYFQKKFEKWFGDSVPADPPFPTEVDLSIEGFDSIDLPSSSDVHRLNYQTRKSKYDLQKLFELLGYGFSGAVLLGAGVGFLILMINVSLGRLGILWPEQFVIIIFALIIGFWGGMFKRSVEMVLEKHSHKDRY